MVNLLDSLTAISPSIGSAGISFSKKVDEDKTTNLKSPLGPKADIFRASTYTCFDNTKKGLWVKYGEKQFKYKNNGLYSSSNLTEKVSSKQLDKEVNRVLKHLNKLIKKSPYAKNIIQTLQQSENQFTISIVETIASYMVVPLPNGRFGILNNNAYAFQIIETNHLVVDYADFDRIGSSAEIRWNDDDDYLTLAHELSHAYDANYGLMDDRLTKIDGMTMSVREIRALFHENMIRKEMNKDFRINIKGGHALIYEDQPFTHPLPYRARH